MRYIYVMYTENAQSVSSVILYRPMIISYRLFKYEKVYGIITITYPLD